MDISNNSYSVKKEENRNQPKFDREKIMKAKELMEVGKTSAEDIWL